MTAIWGNITAKEVVESIKGLRISGKIQTVFSGISTDSRTIGAGELFWALTGECFDGHDFIQMALERGAAGAVVQKDRSVSVSHPNNPAVLAVDDCLIALGDFARWWRHQHRARVVSITGSSGKTTTKEMLAGILRLGGAALVSRGNFNNLIGLPLTLFRLEDEHKNAVLEMGMNRPGEIARLTDISDPDVGVITNVGMAHLAGLGNIKGVARAKVEMVEHILPESRIVLNGDDTLLMETASRFRTDIVTFGMGSHNQVCCREIENLGQNGNAFQITYQGESLPIRLNVPGLQNILNAAAAAAVCQCLSVPGDHVAEGLSLFSGVRGRFELIPLAEGILLVDDTYNANPSSLKATLDSVRTLVGEGAQIIVGLGEMMELGNSAIAAHQEAGRRVAGIGANFFVAIGEHAGDMVQAAIEAGLKSGQAKVVGSHMEMGASIAGQVRPGDLIFLKGSRKMDLGKVVDILKNRYNLHSS